MIVNVSSVASRVPGTGYMGWYAASKHGLNALSEALTMEVAAFGVRVVCIEPGFFATQVMQHATIGGEADPSNPYAADQAWMVDFYAKSVANSGDPAAVAEAIVQAAIDPQTPLHNLVGEDAKVFVDLVEQAGSVEAWLPVGVSIVESVAGPRPV